MNPNDLLGSNNEAEVKITDISDTPFHKVESPATPEKTTTGKPEVKFEMAEAQQHAAGNRPEK